MTADPQQLTDDQVINYLEISSAGFIPPRSVILEAARRLRRLTTAVVPGDSQAGRASYEPESGDNGGPGPSAATATPGPSSGHRATLPGMPLATRQLSMTAGAIRARALRERARVRPETTLQTPTVRDRAHAVRTGGKGGVFLPAVVEDKAETPAEGRKQEEQHTPSDGSLPLRDRAHEAHACAPNAPDRARPCAPPCAPPAAPADWGFAEWWARWERHAESLNPGRVGDRRKALAAWKKAGHTADPTRPLQQLDVWARKPEWAERGALPNPERFLEDHKYCPPRKQAWRPSAALQQLPHEVWCRALLDAEMLLKHRNMLAGEAGAVRQAVLARSADDRACLLNRFWHDLIGETPTVRAHELYGSTTQEIA